MTVGELLEELHGLDSNIEIAIAIEHPKGIWAIEGVSIVDEEGHGSIVHLICDVPQS
jgi:hypothetical protein